MHRNALSLKSLLVTALHRCQKWTGLNCVFAGCLATRRALPLKGLPLNMSWFPSSRLTSEFTVREVFWLEPEIGHGDSSTFSICFNTGLFERVRSRCWWVKKVRLILSDFWNLAVTFPENLMRFFFLSKILAQICLNMKLRIINSVGSWLVLDPKIDFWLSIPK